jgi:hypothetical protein
LAIFVDNMLINATKPIRLVNDYSNKTYGIICAAISSKPTVNLTIYDTNTSMMLSNSSNSQIQYSCDVNNVCNTILAISFQFNGNQFNSLTSLSCSANSSNTNVPLFLTTSRNVTVTLLSKRYF